MSQQQPIYLNGLAIGPGYAGHTHIYTARQYRGKGDPSYDMQLIVDPTTGQKLNQQAYEWARAWFTEAEWASPAMRWPAKLIDRASWPTCDDVLLEKFPGWFVVSARKKAEYGPVGVIDTAGGPLPPGQKVSSGNWVLIAADLATYRESASNVGISCRLGQVAYINEGIPLALGAGGAKLDMAALQAAQAAAANAPRPPGVGSAAPQGQGYAPPGQPTYGQAPQGQPGQGYAPPQGQPASGQLPQGYFGGVPPIDPNQGWQPPGQAPQGQPGQGYAPPQGQPVYGQAPQAPQAPQGGMPPGNGGGFSW